MDGQIDSIGFYFWKCPYTGYYKVYARWTADGAHANNAKYIVTSTHGSCEVLVDQQQKGGTDNLLGTFHFGAGNVAIRLSNDEANGRVVADSVKLEFVSE